MPKASGTFKDPSHVRIYAAWLELQSYKSLSFTARALLVEILGRAEPHKFNGKLCLPSRRLADWLDVSPVTAAKALNELIDYGWVSVERSATFRTKNKAGLYAVTMFRNVVTSEPPTFDFQCSVGTSPALKRKTIVKHSSLNSEAGCVLQ